MPACKVAKSLSDSPDACPLDFSKMTSCNARRCRFTKRTSQSEKRRLFGEVSNEFGSRKELKKASSDWCKAKPGDNVFSSVNVEEHEMNAANGARAKNALRSN